jgi:hypothetical protein
MQAFTGRARPEPRPALDGAATLRCSRSASPGGASTCSRPALSPVIATDRGGPGHLSRPRPGGRLPAADLRRAGLRRARAGAADRSGGDRGARRLRNPRTSAATACPACTSAGEDRGHRAARSPRGCTYHGVSLNARMDLEPFAGNRSLRLSGPRLHAPRRPRGGDTLAVQQRLSPRPLPRRSPSPSCRTQAQQKRGLKTPASHQGGRAEPCASPNGSACGAGGG